MSNTITYSYCTIKDFLVTVEKTNQWFNIYHSIPDGIQDLLENHREFLAARDSNVLLVHNNRRVYLDIGGTYLEVDDDMLTIEQEDKS